MGTLAPKSGDVVCLDANVVIYAVESIEPYATLLGPIWVAANSGTVRLIGSELLIMETLTGPMKSGDQKLVDAYERFLRARDLSLHPITEAILRKGAALRAKHGLKGPDAIHAATAMEIGCAIFLTNDTRFRSIAGFPATILADVLAS